MVNKVKVAFLIGSLNRGGSETLLLDIISNNKETFINYVIIYNKDGDLTESFKGYSDFLFKLESSKHLSKLKLLLQLRKIIKNERVQIIHSHQNIYTIFAFLACLGLSTIIIQTIHGWTFRLSYFDRMMAKISNILADRIFFVSHEQMKQHLVNRMPKSSKKCNVIYNGIDFSKLNTNLTGGIRQNLEISNNQLLLGMVGNFTNVRDPKLVCRFLSLLKKSGLDFSFLFIGKKDVGNPHLFDDCVAYCHNNNLASHVKFLGSRHDVPSILPELDGFIYSTNYDTFGIGVIEAMAAGIPVFVNDWKVMKEITADGAFANLYKTKDEQDLMRIFSTFLANPFPFREKAARAASWVRETYSIGRHIHNLDQAYHNLLKIN